MLEGGRASESSSKAAPGAGSGFADDAYAAAGAVIAGEAKDVWARADMIMKVKEPLPEEFGYFRDGSDAVHLPASCRRGRN